MDKFGIFKLLSSFVDFYSSQKTDNSTLKNNGESSLLSGLFSLPTEKKPLDKPLDKPTPNSKPFPPLQQQMLLTMRSHDEFVKRVNSNKK